MKKTTRWVAGLMLAAGLLTLFMSQARAAHPDVATTTAGMLTFYTIAEVESPTDGQVVSSPHTFVNNPTTPVGNRNHKVKITGPPNGGNINIDYSLSFDVDSNNVGSTTITNTMAGLDGFGLWIVNPVYSASLSVTTDSNSADSWSYMKFIPNGQMRQAYHTHNFTH